MSRTSGLYRAYQLKKEERPMRSKRLSLAAQKYKPFDTAEKMIITKTLT